MRKCAVAHMRGGKLTRGGYIPIPKGDIIGEIQEGETYKYLGVSQLIGPSIKLTKARIEKEYIA